MFYFKFVHLGLFCPSLSLIHIADHLMNNSVYLISCVQARRTITTNAVNNAKYSYIKNK